MNRFGKVSFAAQKGFTLIELMIVVAIVGILAAIAMPSYQNYTAKAQSSEAVMLAESVKRDVELVFVMNRECPTNGQSGIAAATSITGKYVDNVVAGGTFSDAGGCTVEATFKSLGVSPKIAKAVIKWTLAAGENTSQWKCETLLSTSLGIQGCTTVVAADGSSDGTGSVAGKSDKNGSAGGADSSGGKNKP
jgi:type IV pilus assembly protein PilA